MNSSCPGMIVDNTSVSKILIIDGMYLFLILFLPIRSIFIMCCILRFFLPIE
jgi:hypothetical protein